jgi:hypothetical protein
MVDNFDVDKEVVDVESCLPELPIIEPEKVLT